jgi:hypothetical protein
MKLYRRRLPIIIVGLMVALSGRQASMAGSSKCGIAMGKLGPNAAIKTSAAWYYDWGLTPRSETVPEGFAKPEFVPMMWGASQVTDKNIMALKNGKDSGTYKYLLGFNEPDQSGQANMTVDKAISLWPQLTSTGLLLGSPAPAWPTSSWLSDFMKQASAKNLHVDFISLHYYRSPAAANSAVDELKSLLTTAYNTYHKPIWLTEFGAPDCNALGWCGTAAPLTQKIVDDYVKQVVAMLQNLSFVQRYAWFIDVSSDSGFNLSALFTANGVLTQTGIDFRDACESSVATMPPYCVGSKRGTDRLKLNAFGSRIVVRLPLRATRYEIRFNTLNGREVSRVQGIGSGDVAVSTAKAGLFPGTYVAIVIEDNATIATKVTVHR